MNLKQRLKECDGVQIKRAKTPRTIILRKRHNMPECVYIELVRFAKEAGSVTDSKVFIGHLIAQAVTFWSRANGYEPKNVAPENEWITGLTLEVTKKATPPLRSKELYSKRKTITIAQQTFDQAAIMSAAGQVGKTICAAVVAYTGYLAVQIGIDKPRYPQEFESEGLYLGVATPYIVAMSRKKARLTNDD